MIHYMRHTALPWHPRVFGQPHVPLLLTRLGYPAVLHSPYRVRARQTVPRKGHRPLGLSNFRATVFEDPRLVQRPQYVSWRRKQRNTPCLVPSDSPVQSVDPIEEPSPEGDMLLPSIQVCRNNQDWTKL